MTIEIKSFERSFDVNVFNDQVFHWWLDLVDRKSFMSPKNAWQLYVLKDFIHTESQKVQEIFYNVRLILGSQG